jgi:hypothetical protein
MVIGILLLLLQGILVAVSFKFMRKLAATLVAVLWAAYLVIDLLVMTAAHDMLDPVNVDIFNFGVSALLGVVVIVVAVVYPLKSE